MDSTLWLAAFELSQRNLQRFQQLRVLLPQCVTLGFRFEAAGLPLVAIISNLLYLFDCILRRFWRVTSLFVLFFVYVHHSSAPSRAPVRETLNQLIHSRIR